MYCGGRNLSHELVAIDDYIASPKSDGYRSKHLVFRYRNPKSPAYDGLHIELQIRTRLQHSWATAVETVDVFMDQSIKAGRATPEWGRFFSLASMAFAKLEGLPVLHDFERISLSSIGRSLRSAEKTLDVVNRLRGFRVATNAIISRERDRPSFLHLVVLNTATRTLSFRSFSESQQEEANEAYTQAEEQRSQGHPLDPVLVAGGNLRQLKKSYPNYFADTEQFVRHLASLIR